MIAHYLNLTKTGIVIFVLLSALAGFAMSFPVGQPLDMITPLTMLLGVYLLSAGSFSLNQAQEWKKDNKMDRTKTRPIPLGVIMPWQAVVLGIAFMLLGLFILLLMSPLAAFIGLMTVLLYNGVYTYVWKPKSAFAAVPGAIPGALPVVLGYAINTNNLWNTQVLYLFAVLFLWQMPHFWAIAIKYQKDYEQGGFPVLPLVIGTERTLFHIGLYLFAYLGLVLSAPFFVRTDFLYVLVIVPLTLKLVWESYKFIKSRGEQNWLPFFLWITLSVVFYLAVPVLDRWIFVFLRS